MTEPLEYVAEVRSDSDLVRLVNAEVPTLRRRLSVRERRVEGELADGERVFAAFDEIKALFWFARRHGLPVIAGRSGRSLEAIVRDRRSVYLGGLGSRRDSSGVLIPSDIATVIFHYRGGGPSGNSSDPHCELQGSSFLAAEIGFAWDAMTNKGRAVYQCPSCKACFHLEEYATPEHDDLANALRLRSTRS